jgi:hypothetical protein
MSIAIIIVLQTGYQLIKTILSILGRIIFTSSISQKDRIIREIYL